MKHPLCQFQFCSVCGAKAFAEHNEKVKKCIARGFAYHFNSSSAVACFIKNAKGGLLLAHQEKEPAKGTLSLPGGFVDMFESGEGAVHREVREEAGLHVQSCRYLFSLPNLYMCSGSEAYALDMFYECLIDDFNDVHVEDDAAEIVILRPEDMNPEDFGLDSVRRVVPAYLGK